MLVVALFLMALRHSATVLIRMLFDLMAIKDKRLSVHDALVAFLDCRLPVERSALPGILSSSREFGSWMIVLLLLFW